MNGLGNKGYFGFILFSLYTDFPLDILEVYCIDNVVLLKGEYSNEKEKIVKICKKKTEDL